jgi:hypothetical protein
MTMHQPGPPLETLLRRLADTPQEFLDEPRIAAVGQVFVPAVVNDLLARISTRAAVLALEPFRGNDRAIDRNRLMVTMVMTWLLADEWFERLRLPQADLLQVLNETATELAAYAAAQKYLLDPQRREELARLSLARLGLRPAGETAEQATDRLSAISAPERNRLLQASRAAQERARAIREALVRQQAEAAADKWTRE